MKDLYNEGFNPLMKKTPVMDRCHMFMDQVKLLLQKHDNIVKLTTLL